MDDENQTGISQLSTLIIILALLFVFSPGVRNIALMKPDELINMYGNLAKMQSQSISKDINTYEQFIKEINTQKPSDLSKNSFHSHLTQEIPPELDRFFSQYGYKQKAANGKRLVIYSNMPGKNDDEKMERVKIFRSYAVNADWNKKYTFIEAKFNENIMQFKSQDDYKTFLKFGVNCGYFCIVDYNNNFIYKGEKSADSNYIYDVMADFYK